MKALLVIAQKGYQDVELKGTRDGLVNAGFDVVLASTEKGSCAGKFGSTEEATLSLKDVQISDYDRIGLIGGPGAAALAANADAKKLVRDVLAAGMILGAICIAPTILAAAGVLTGKRATVWDDGKETQINILKEAGAVYSGEAVTVDGKIITANGPDAAVEFGKRFATL